MGRPLLSGQKGVGRGSERECSRGTCFLPRTYPPTLRLVFGGMHLFWGF